MSKVENNLRFKKLLILLKIAGLHHKQMLRDNNFSNCEKYHREKLYSVYPELIRFIENSHKSQSIDKTELKLFIFNLNKLLSFFNIEKHLHTEVNNRREINAVDYNNLTELIDESWEGGRNAVIDNLYGSLRKQSSRLYWAKD